MAAVRLGDREAGRAGGLSAAANAQRTVDAGFVEAGIPPIPGDGG